MPTTGESAVGHFESALALDALATRPLERARIELLLGESLRRDRHRIRARDHLRSALVAFERLGAAPWADRARAELRATGETTRPRDASGLEQLTPQELQVAQYAAAGESNADIAAKLFLSRRTRAESDPGRQVHEARRGSLVVATATRAEQGRCDPG